MKTPRSFFLQLLLILSIMIGVTSCKSADDERIPDADVYLPLTLGQWNVYGAAGAGQYAIFDKAKALPAGFPYTAMQQTGYGGILIVTDYMGNHLAYSACCPVERNNKIVLQIVDENHVQVARCTECGSTYDVFSGHGAPLSGPALNDKYALTPYKISATDLYPVVVTNR